MSVYDNRLNLVLNGSANNPLVLDAHWEGEPPRKKPNLKEVGQAKQRLHSFCILLLLAKFEEWRHRVNGLELPLDRPLTFQVEIPRNTWIYSLGIAFEKRGFRKWIRERCRIRNDELFVKASGGTADNGGNEWPVATYYPNILHPCTLDLTVKPHEASKSEAAELYGRSLLDLAREIERRHWRKSTIEILYPEWFASFPDKNGSVPTERSNVAMFLERVANASFQNPDRRCTAKEYYFSIFEALIEKEIDVYREISQPFFSYISNSAKCAKNPYLWEPRLWNTRQCESLRDNCIFYCSQMSVFCWGFVSRPGIYSDIFDGTPWSEFYDSSSFLAAPRAILCRLASTAKVKREWEEPPSAKNLPKSIIREADWFVREMISGLGERTVSISIGTFFALQAVQLDFLEQVCAPLYSPLAKPGFTWRGHQGDEVELHLFTVIAGLKHQISKNSKLMLNWRDRAREFYDAANAAGTIFQSQATFWKALHRRLVSLED